MRYTLIALAIAGCGGHSTATDGDGAVSQALTLDEIARACVNGYGCLKPPIDGPTMQTCLSHLDDIDTIVSIYRPAQIRCLAEAGANCVAARACVGYSYGACSPSGQHCDGDRVVDCSSAGSGLTLDCRNGLWFTSDSTCVTGTSVDCGIGTCTSGTPSRCDGSHIVTCKSGVLQAIDCAQVGYTCSTASGRAACVASGAACTVSRCEGNQLIRCDSGHEQRYACDAMLAGSTCVDDGSGASCAFGPACGSVPACAGNATQLCVLGAQVSIDCVAAGFASCDLGSCIPATFP